MNKILDYLKIATLLVAVLIGVQVPGFVSQYGQQLHARWAESSVAVEQFQQDANQYFDGDLNALIEHYKKTGDPVFLAGGDSISVILLRNQQLGEALASFSSSTFNAYRQVLLQPLPEVKADTWQHYRYQILLDQTAIFAAVVAAIFTLIVMDLLLFLLALGCSSLRQSPNEKRQHPKVTAKEQ